MQFFHLTETVDKWFNSNQAKKTLLKALMAVTLNCHRKSTSACINSRPTAGSPWHEIGDCQIHCLGAGLQNGGEGGTEQLRVDVSWGSNRGNRPKCCKSEPNPGR